MCMFCEGQKIKSFDKYDECFTLEIREKSLVVDVSVEFGYNSYTVNQPIKFCPFCGKKL